MKFRVERAALADAVAWAARSLPARPTLPVLAGLMIEATDRTLVLSGFDYDISARVEVPAEVDEEGRTLVSGRLLADITRSLPNRAVEMSTDGTRVSLVCGSARFVLLTLPLEDYPELPSLPPASGSVSGATLASAVAQVGIAAGRDDTLPVLTGVQIEIDAETVTLAATDRYRLGVRELQWTPEQTGLSATALVPARTLIEAAKAFSGADKVVMALATGSRGEGLIGFEGGGRRTTARLLDGLSYPKFRGLLPTDSTSVATVDTASFAEAVRRVALVAERSGPLHLAFADEAVKLTAGRGDEAQAAESLPAVLEGEAIEVAFNPGYLLDALGALDTPSAQLAFTTPSKPVLVVGRYLDDDGAPGELADHYRHLLMPVRL